MRAFGICLSLITPLRSGEMSAQIYHIALVLGSMRMGGAERASLNLINEFVARGVRCDLVLVQAEGELLSELDPEVNIVPLGKGRTLYSVFAMRRYLKKIRPQVVIAGQTHVQIMTLLARKRSLSNIPVILNEHSTFSTNNPGSTFKGRLTRLFAKYIFNHADAITAVSQGVKKDLLQEFPFLGPKLDVIYNPVVGRTLFEKSRLEVQMPWDKRESIPVILGLGRLVPDKDFENLLHAVAIARKSQRIRLLIAGDGPDKEKLVKLAEKLSYGNDINFMGLSDNPYSLMKQADLFVLSSRREGLPMSLIEALACGCRVVSTDCESGPSEILNKGEYGRLVPVADADLLSKAILSSLKDKVQKDSGNEAIHPFYVETVCDNYSRLIISLLGRRVKA